MVDMSHDESYVIMAKRASSLFVKSMNLSLLPLPPPKDELTGQDVCFLGPLGESDENSVVYCRDLVVGQRGVVGSW